MDTRYHGTFIVFEGLDTAGKTTISKMLHEKLLSEGKKVYLTEEPTKETTLGALCRKYLKDHDSLALVDVLLFAADRLEHYFNQILPKLKEGYVVISDRYKHSSFVYQQLQGVDLEWIREVNKYAPTPDLVIYLDLQPEIAVSRLRKKTIDLEKFETIEQLKKVHTLYSEFSDDFHTVDASKSVSDVFADISDIVTKYISENH